MSSIHQGLSHEQWQWPWELRQALRRGLLRVPLLPFAGALWLGCAFGGDPRWLGWSALVALAARRSLATQVLLGLLLGSLLARGEPPPSCPPPGAAADPQRQWIGRVLSIEPSRDDRSSLMLDLIASRLIAGKPIASRRTAGGRSTGDAPLRCRALISAGRRPPELLEGDVVALSAIELEPPAHLINPGSGDSAAALVEQGVERVGSLADGAGILPLRHAAYPSRWAARLRAMAEARLRRLPPGNAREMVRALALGERSAFSPALSDALRDSGLRHLLTLGLLYLSLWMALLGALLMALWSRSERLALLLPAQRAAALATLPIPALYGVLGNGPTAGRAMAVGLTVAAAASLGRRGAHPLHLFSLGLVALLCAAPRQADRPALIWSFAALAGIWGLAGPILSAIGGQATGRCWARARAELSRIIAIGAAAFAATAPLQLATSGHLPWLGVPLTAVALAAALPASFLAQLGALTSSGVLLRAAAQPAALLADLAITAAPFGRARWPMPPAAALVAGLCWVVGLAAGLRRRGALCALLWGAGAAVAIAPPIWRMAAQAIAPRVRLTFLSVGHGDSMVLETPHGLALLIDAGGSVVGDFDPGREIVIPFLEWRGIRRLEAAVLTHPHPDHANGLPAILGSFEVGELWQSGEPCPLPACAEMAALEAAKGIRHVALGSEPFTRSLDGVELTLLSPQLPGGYDPQLGPNDNSLVFRLRYGGFTALLTGDIEAAAEGRLLASGRDLGAFLLKAPHHGSDTSSTPELVARVHPEAVIFSVGPRNRFGFPRPQVCERYRRIGARAYRTDRDGAVTVESDGSRVWIGAQAPGRPPFASALAPPSPRPGIRL